MIKIAGEFSSHIDQKENGFAMQNLTIFVKNINLNSGIQVWL